MSVTVPNIEDSPSYDAMAVRDSADLFALSCDAQGTGVASGMAVTGAAGSVMAVAIASGVVTVGGTSYTYAGSASVGVGAASTSDRRDSVVYIVGTGASVIAGTPCGYTTGKWTVGVTTNNPPVKPTMPANSVLLAEVYVAGSGGTATTFISTVTNIVDKRTTIAAYSTMSSGTLASTPTSTGSGQQYYATDDNGGRVWIDTGTGPLAGGGSISAGGNTGWSPASKAGSLWTIQATSSFTITNTADGTGAEISALRSPTVQVYNRPIRLTFQFGVIAASVSQVFTVYFTEDYSGTGTGSNVGAWRSPGPQTAGAAQGTWVTFSEVISPAAGGHTFSVKAVCSNITGASLDASAARPMTFTVEEL